MVGCNSKSINIDEHAKTVQNMGELSSFSLDNPLNNTIVSGVDEFKWNASTNAETYILEVCSSDMFISNVETIDYYKRENITDTSFKFNTTLALRDTNYYWRVTAKNTGGTKVCDSVFSFYVSAADVEEVNFNLGESDDWKLHDRGSRADISVNDSNFFGEVEPTLKVAFKMEDTKRGNPESDGWLITSKTIEKSIYGTDALFFNCFYAGHDSNIFIRLIDRDNEFWHCPIQISRNAKQSVILKFSDFEQRTRDVTVANMTFDFERIKTLEIVFERTFGDGVFLLSNMRAIKFSNYKHLFIEKLNFNSYSSDQYIKDAYQFEYEIHDDYELQMNYYGKSNTQGKPGINGYGFVKINVNQYMFTGNAVKMSVKYTGVSGTNVLLRVYEEDTDRWSYKVPFSYLTEGEYKTIIIPFDAFASSSLMGDGRRQFYFILNLQFGLEGEYGTGSLFFKDFEVIDITSDEYKREDSRVVDATGLVEDFNNYDFNSDMYFIWQHSTDNKDEYMNLNKINKVGNNNIACGQFEYKSDMAEALYYIPVTVSDNFSSISLWLKDASVLSGNEKVAFFTNWSPDATIKIRLATGEIYGYTIKSLDRVWNQYDIPFSEFEILNEDELISNLQPITSASITHIGIGFTFLYITDDGVHIPVYSMNNPVFIDNIYLSNFEAYKKNAKERVVTYNSKTKLAKVEDFESYANNDEMLDFWSDGKTYSYQHKELSDDVSSQGGNKSLKLKYLTRDNSPSYQIIPAIGFDDDVKTFRFDVRSELSATVYMNFYVRGTVGGTETQYRATLTEVSDKWTTYIIGYANITDPNNSESTFNKNYVPIISRITFGVTSFVTTDSQESYIYIDNLSFDGHYTKNDTYVVQVIDA